MAADSAPPSVRFIRGLRDGLQRHGRRAAILLALAVGLLWLAAGVSTIENGASGALLTFGRLTEDRVEPGLRMTLPGVHRLIEVRTAEVLRREVRGDFVPEIELVTGDENLIEATLVVQYRIADLGDYLFATDSPEALVEQVVRGALVEAFASTPVDEVLTSAKAALQITVRDAAQAKLDAYHAGVDMVAVNLQTVTPPPEAAGAFRAVNDARAEAAQAVSVAQGNRDRDLRLARGTASRIETEAGARAESRRAEARGRADRFNALERQNRLAPGPTHTELWNATIRKALPRARLIFLQPGEKPDVHVYLLPEDDAPPSPSSPSPPPPSQPSEKP